MLSKEQIFNFKDLDTEIVDVPEWGGEVCIKSLSVADQMDIDAKKGGFAPGQIIIEMLIRSCVDENGNRLFELEDYKRLEQKSSQPIMRLFNAIVKLNSVKDDDIKEEAKNS